VSANPPPHTETCANHGPPATTEAAQLSSSAERLRDLLAHRPLEVDLELTLERRVRAYAQRLNHRLARSGDHDLYDTRKDAELAQVVMLLCETALASEEQAMPPPKAGAKPPRRPRVSG
jgi:hypothetical protein